jgi:RNA polymerase sigma-70 factor (ECF subfamily)
MPSAGADPSVDQVVLPHLDAAYNLARWLMRDASAAEDVVQDAVVRAIAHIATFRGGNARAWLLRIVRNTAYDALQRRRSAAATEVPLDAAGEQEDGTNTIADIADSGATPERALENRQQLQSLDRALAALPVELRECMILREIEDLSYRDIARITAVPMGTVMSRLWRARRLLLAAQEDENVR